MTDTDTTVTTPLEGVTADPIAELEALRAKYEKAQRDIQKYRTRADEVDAARKSAEAESLKHKTLEEQLATLAKRAEDAERRAQEFDAKRAEAVRMAALTGKVADPKAALKLLDPEHLTDDGDVNVDALLAAYPFLAPTPAAPTAPARPLVPSANATRGIADAPLRPDDFRGKSPAWIEANLHRLKTPPPQQ